VTVRLTPLDEWFAASNSYLIEAALMRYLVRIWRKQAEIPDISQEIYARVFESAMKRPTGVAKAFLFVTARNLLADRVRVSACLD